MRLFIGLTALVAVSCVVAGATPTTAKEVAIDAASVAEPISLTDVTDVGAVHANAADSREPRSFGYGGLGIYGGLGFYGGYGGYGGYRRPWGYGGYGYRPWRYGGYGYRPWGYGYGRRRGYGYWG